jgi:hypothetical protein
MFVGSGDPDLYISVPPNYQPTRENYTWTSRGFGADTLTLQADEIHKHCMPDPFAGTGCDFYISVYGCGRSTCIENGVALDKSAHS